MMLTEIFYHVDNFCNDLPKLLSKNVIPAAERHLYKYINCKMPLSDVMTILIYFHHSGYRNFKKYYKDCYELKGAFNEQLSYNRFVEIIPHSIYPLFLFMNLYRLGTHTGIGFIGSTKLQVCHNLRIGNHKVFAGFAARGKTSTGWFFGFKLHLIINERGEIMAFSVTAGNVADNNRSLVSKLAKNITGKLFGDRGFISSKLFEDLYAQGITLVTKLKRNMKNKLMEARDKFFLSKRGIVESVNDILKSGCQIEHSRHRSPLNFFANVFAGLVAYSFLPKKPHLECNFVPTLIG